MNLEQLYEGPRKFRTATNKVVGGLNKNRFDVDARKAREVADDAAAKRGAKKIHTIYTTGEQKLGPYTIGNSRAVSQATSDAIKENDVDTVQAALKLALIELPKIRARLPQKDSHGQDNRNKEHHEKMVSSAEHMNSTFDKAIAFLSRKRVGEDKPSLTDVAGGAGRKKRKSPTNLQKAREAKALEDKGKD